MNIIDNIKIKKNDISIIFIVIVGVISRFIKLSELFFFNIDEDRYHFILHKIVILHMPVLTGWDLPIGILVPPVNYYFGSLIMIFSGNNLLGFAATASIFGVCGIILTYYVCIKLFKSRSLSLFASLIYSLSFFINIYNRLSINLLFAPILSLLTYISLSKVIVEKKKKWLIVLSVIFVFSTQEGSMLSLILLTIVCLLVYRVKYKLKDLIVPLGIFFSSFIPLLIFDLRHNFYISRKFADLFTTSSNISSLNLFFLKSYILMFRTYSRVLFPTGPSDINIQILPCENYLMLVNNSTPYLYSLLGFLIIGFFIYKALSSKSSFGQKIITYHLLVVLFGLFIYSILNKGNLYEWFFIVLTPAFCIITAYFLEIIKNKYLGKLFVGLFLLIFSLYNIKYLYNLTSTIGFQDKITAVKYIQKVVRDGSFSLNMVGNGCNGYGYRYLLTYINTEPEYSYTDSMYHNWSNTVSTRGITDYDVYLVMLPDIDSDSLKEKYQEVKDAAFHSNRINNIEILFVRRSKE